LKYFILIILAIFMTSCVNKKGISMKYYDDCHFYYDLYGTYKEDCPHNFINFKKEKEGVEKCLQCK